MILSIYFTLPPPSDVIIRFFCVFRNICFMFFVIFVLAISSFLFYVFRLGLWLITVCPYRSSQPTLVEFDRFSRSRTTRSCGFTANILHSESTSFTSWGTGASGACVNRPSEARPLVRVQLSPPSASPCRSRACFFLSISVFVYPGVHDCCVYSAFTHKSTILYSSFCGGFGMAFLPAIGLPSAPA